MNFVRMLGVKQKIRNCARKVIKNGSSSFTNINRSKNVKIIILALLLLQIGVIWWFFLDKRDFSILNFKSWKEKVVNASAKSDKKDQRPHRIPYIPDLEFITKNKAKLIEAIKKLNGRFQNSNFDLMIKTMHPSVWTDVKNIKCHSPSGKTLLLDDIHQSIYDYNHIVPNAIHFILPFFQTQIQFHHAVCILSAYWISKPKKMFIWYNEQPSGEWWNYVQKNISDWENKVIFVHRAPPNKIYDQPIFVKEHMADIIRMEALITFGGAYFDLDVITLKSLEPLKNYSFTIGRERPDGLCNGVMLAHPNSTFMLLHHLAYQTFDDGDWEGHSVRLPHYMEIQWPSLVHVEAEGMDRPNWYELSLIYSKDRSWKWREKNYCMHLWYRKYGVQHDLNSIKTLDSTLGDMFRYVLFGT